MFRKIEYIALASVFWIGAAAAMEAPIPVMGNWQGHFVSNEWQDRTLRAQIVGESWDTYRVNLFVGIKSAEEKSGQLKGKTEKGETPFVGQIDLGEKLGGTFTIAGKAAKGVFTGVFQGSGGEQKFEMKRVILKPPTLGMAPPEGAVVLLDINKPFDEEWIIPSRWEKDKDGAIHTTYGSIVSKKSFSDGEYHVEFMTPYMPNERGQARGNSGVYILGRYEVQVLDSFADKPEDNLCGGIYQIATPLVNACLPPLEWQTYDITFFAPRFDANGKKIKNAELTVKHNGILIHDKFSLPRLTPGGVSEKEAAAGPILIQDHTDRPLFRNFWVKPLK